MMKNIKFILLLTIINIFSSCVDVVHVNLNTATPRLVIEASIVWEKRTRGNEQMIKLSTTTGYYNNVIPTVSNAIVYVESEDGTKFIFEEKENSGQYICTSFSPKLGKTFRLTVILNEETYTATETLQPVASLNYVKQVDGGSFNNKQKEVFAYFTDPKGISNYYLTQKKSTLDAVNKYIVIKDKLFDGEEKYISYTHKDLVAGHVVDFKLYGISKGYYEYLKVLLSAAENNPFTSPPGTIRGNIINTTNPDNYCLGFFSLSRASKRTHTVQ